MIFNRVINDIVDWIRRLLYWKSKQIKQKPYAVIEMYTCSDGILKLVDRDTARAVLTYIYTPKPKNTTNVVGHLYDYHICLDHLWKISEDEEPSAQSFKLTNKVPSFKPVTSKLQKNIKLGDYTHVLTILKSSRTLDVNGDYVTEVIFYKQFDFVGLDITGYRDKFALPIVKDVVHRLKEGKFKDLDWDFELGFSQKKFMGSYYIKPKTV